MSNDWRNNTNKQYMKALEALQDLGTRDATPYHLSADEADAQGIPRHGLVQLQGRPDIQSEARYNTIMQRTQAVKAAIAAIKAEMVYNLQPATDRVD